MIETPMAHGPVAETEEPDEPIEEGLVAGRPVEDRSFEVVEIGVGASLGLAIGAAVAGPIGAAAGVVVGAAAGFVAGEAIERAAGHAAETTDATEHEPPSRV
ncbi:MAG TPA: hypothetical protein VER83_06780 [Candidatus Nanopelagicales bacterium]|nr:hypothetical protein [Candidatus Nanopelagicales bacterium]